jgi:hypothetical protein
LIVFRLAQRIFVLGWFIYCALLKQRIDCVSEIVPHCLLVKLWRQLHLLVDLRSRGGFDVVTDLQLRQRNLEKVGGGFGFDLRSQRGSRKGVAGF